MKSELEWANFFISKFENTKEEDWCTGQQQDEQGRRCAFGHCAPNNMKYVGNMSYYNFPEETINEAKALIELGFNLDRNDDCVIIKINNGIDPDYQQSTPKARVLAALYNIKDKLEPEVKERIVYVSIDKEVL